MTLSTQATGDVPQCAVCGQYMYATPHYCPRAQSAGCLTGGFTAYTDDSVRAALTRIAADHEKTLTGHRRRMSRDEMVLLAREVCLAMGWEWSRRG